MKRTFYSRFMIASKIYDMEFSQQHTWCCTMGQIKKKHGINSHAIIYFPTSEGVSEVSEHTNEWYKQTSK